VAARSARECLKQGALVIDVRTREEFHQRHLPKVVNLPLDQLQAEIARLAPDKSQPLLLHCLSGTRSAMGKTMLKNLGYQKVFNLGSYGRAVRILASRIP
jgi:phage shock protein E